MPAARHLVKHNAGFQGINREQHRQRQGTAKQGTDLRQTQITDLVPALGDRGEITLTAHAQRANDQRIVGQFKQAGILHGKTKVGQHTSQNADNRPRQVFGDLRPDQNTDNRRAPHNQRMPIPH